MTDVFVAIAHRTSGLPGSPALIAVGFTAELANAALQSLIDDADEPGGFVIEKAESHTVAEAPASKPAWRELSEDDQELLTLMQIEEVRDCVREIAHEMLDELDAESVQEMLQALKEDQEGVI